MRRTHRHRTVLGSIITGLAVFASLLVSPSPAQAYDGLNELKWMYAAVDTDNCALIAGNLSVVARTNDCYLNDSADDTYFVKDAGGVALKIELRLKSTGAMVAKAEFHPYGEKVWVYDTRNDDDAIYFDTIWGNSDGWTGYQAPTGTSATIDYKVIDLDLAEGTHVEMWAFDWKPEYADYWLLDYLELGAA